MTRTTWILLGLLAAIAASPAGLSVSASAAECKKEANKKFILCLGEPLTLVEGTLTIGVSTDPGTTLVLYSPSSGLKLLASGILLAPGWLESSVAKGIVVQGISLNFINVNIDQPAGCKVHNESIKTELLTGTIENSEKEKMLVRPVTGETIAAFKIESDGTGCAIAGSYDVTLTEKAKGGVLCTAPVEVSRVEQLPRCRGVELLVAEVVAEFEGSFLTAVFRSGIAEKWAVIEGK